MTSIWRDIYIYVMRRYEYVARIRDDTSTWRAYATRQAHGALSAPHGAHGAAPVPSVLFDQSHAHLDASVAACPCTTPRLRHHAYDTPPMTRRLQARRLGQERHGVYEAVDTAPAGPCCFAHSYAPHILGSFSRAAFTTRAQAASHLHRGLVAYTCTGRLLIRACGLHAPAL
jgi:hypothetical protein